MIRAMLSLTFRQSFILNRVVDVFIETGHPVSSQAVADASPSPVSPATVRHEMGTLEGCGYLAQAHHSSGRVPTDRGYRHYLDSGITETGRQYQDYFNGVSNRFSQRFTRTEDLPELMEESAGVLSGLSRQLGLLVIPDTGSAAVRDARWAMTAQGLRYLLDQPECRDTAVLRPLVKAIEEREKLKKWIETHSEINRPQAFVGSEHQVEDMDDYAIVTARYEAGSDGPSGAIAVIGLKRMAYARVLPIVSEMARVMGQALQRMEERA